MAQRTESRGPSRRRLGWKAVAASMIVAGLVLAGIWFTNERRVAPAGVAASDIILVTIDTLRADALGFAGNSRVKTPFLDRLAADGIVFTNAHAHNVVTLPSHVNILTGLLPFEHGVRENSGFVLDAKYKTIADHLRGAGYATGAFVGAYPLDSRYGLNRGFDTYDDRYREGSAPLDFAMPERSADEVLLAASSWFASQEGKKRFLWVHLFDPHAPYRPPGRFAAEYRSDPYLGEVAATDDALGRFLAPLVERAPSAFVVVTADHGEALGDHGERTHSLFAYEATLKVPLLVYDKANPGRRVDGRLVSHIDIAPTILARAGVRVEGLRGRSLLAASGEREVYFESLTASLNRGWAPLTGLIEGHHKYIDLPIPELYDLPVDPQETKNIVGEERRIAARARQRLAELAATSAQIARRPIAPDEKANLLSLGYLTGVAGEKQYTAEDDPKNLVHLDAKLQRVVELYQAADVRSATSLAQELIRERDMPEAREMLAFLLQQTEQPAMAIEALQNAVRDGTASDAMRVRLGMILSESGRAKEALTILAPLSNRNDPDTLNAYGVALADVGDLGTAVKQFERVLAIDPTNATAYQHLGVVALRANRPDRSLQYLEKALELNDRLPLALNTLGVVFMRMGRPDQALESWRRAVELEPRMYDALYNLGVVAGQTGRFDVARSALERFVASAPPARYGADLTNARRMLAELERRSS